MSESTTNSHEEDVDDLIRRCRAMQPVHRAGSPSTKINWIPAYIGALVKCGYVGRSADKAGIWSTTVLRERRDNPAFAELEAEAHKASDLRLEDEAIRRAVDGCRQYKFTKGGEPILDPRNGEPYYEDVYSDNLLIKLLSCRIPERYRERLETTGTMKVEITDAEVKERVAKIGKKLIG